MFAGQYKNRRVFITGHTGFKGSWLTAWLLELGATVAGCSIDVPSEPSAFVTLGLEDRITHIQGDVRDRVTLAGAVHDFQPDFVFHLAAQALVRPSYENPAHTFETNALGTMYVLEAVRHTPSVKACVCITSDKCYRNDEWVWGYRETDHLGGHDPYSASKACAEIIAHSYFKSFFHEDGPGVATVRAGNVIGGGDWALDRIVPDCARAYAEKRPVVIRSPHATRPWQHVLEPLSGYLWLAARLAQKDAPGLPLHREAFNFGPAAEVAATVGDVVTALGGHWKGFEASMDLAAAAGKKECGLLKLCCDKALAHLDWRATLDFKETIRFTADWYTAYYQRGLGPKELYAFTAEQLAEYAGKAAAGGLAWAK